MELGDEEREAFFDRGLLHLERLIPRHRVLAAKEAIVSELARLGALVSGKWHVARVPRRFGHHVELESVFEPALLACLGELAGRALQPALPHPQVLLTPPQGGAWSVPHQGWHVDLASPATDGISGIQVFALIDDVAPRGGGTVAVAGSHKLHHTKVGARAGVHHALRADPVAAALFSAEGQERRTTLLAPFSVGGVTLQVVEMSGRAGDVYLMDMRVIHAPATNTTKKARMMLTQRYLPPGRG